MAASARLSPQQKRRPLLATLLAAFAAGAMLLAATRGSTERRGPAFLRTNAGPPSRVRRQLKLKLSRAWQIKKKKKMMKGLIVARAAEPPGALLTTRADCWTFLTARGIRLPGTLTPYEQWEERAWGTCTPEDRARWIGGDCVAKLEAYEVDGDGGLVARQMYGCVTLDPPRDVPAGRGCPQFKS